jgi:hypothetical protein
LQQVVLALVCAVTALEMSCIATLDDEGAVEESVTNSAIKYVFVITFENHDPGQIYGNTADAPYINNTLMAQYARSSNFQDELPSQPSEPHYLWMEAGTNVFSDHTFNSDFPPWFFNSTGNTQHLATQIKNATNGVTWRSYQEGINAQTGACPISDSGFYSPKHNPFVFFRDVAGNPVSGSNAYCASHHKELGALAADLANNAVATYNFITPNLCNDMHGAWGCPDSNKVRSGDTWLHNNLPTLITWANAHAGVIFLVWDEGEGTPTMPFIVVGPHVKPGYVSTIAYNHSSLLKSVERILEMPILPNVSTANDFSDFFQPGYFP